MLTEHQILDVWDNQISAETRSLYFADLASQYTRLKQWITGVTFFLSSGAAATLVGKAPTWVPFTLSLLVAIATAYSVAMNLDSKIKTMAKLHYSWKQISNDYSRLWNHAYEEGAESDFSDLLRREMELSEIATTDAPNDQRLMGRWQREVLRLHRLTSESA